MFADKLTAFTALAKTAVPKLNETLAKHNFSTIMPGKAIAPAPAATKDSE